LNINSKDLLYYGAAICTGIAGILHLTLPMIKRWGRVWYAVGIAGTVILIGLWVITRIADNPITGRGGPISERAIAVEVFQIAYVAITALIMAKERIRKPSSIEEKR
jgi:hypothetical protein